MGGLFSKKTEAPATHADAGHDLSLGKGDHMDIKGTDNVHMGKVDAGAGSELSFKLQNLNSMNLQNLREEPQYLDLTNLAPIEQKLLMKLQAERQYDPNAYVNHLAQLLWVVQMYE